MAALSALLEKSIQSKEKSSNAEKYLRIQEGITRASLVSHRRIRGAKGGEANVEGGKSAD